MVLVCLNGRSVAVDEVGGVVLGASGRDGRESDGLDSVGRPIDDEVVALLAGPTGGLGLREQQPVQVKKQADVRLRFLTTMPSRADDAVMLATRARLASSVSRSGTWLRYRPSLPWPRSMSRNVITTRALAQRRGPDRGRRRSASEAPRRRSKLNNTMTDYAV